MDSHTVSHGARNGATMPKRNVRGPVEVVPVTAVVALTGVALSVLAGCHFCALVPLAVVTSLTGEPVVKADTEVETVPVPNYACHYRNAGGDAAVTIYVILGNGTSWYDRRLR